MKPEIFAEANKIWNRFTKDVTDNDFSLPLKIHKKLLSVFHVGEYYYYVFNVKKSVFELISDEIQPVLGYDPGKVDVPFFLSNIHPDDQPYFLNFENKVTEFFSTLIPGQILNYKVSYDYRIRKKDGNYIRILQQVFAIQLDENKKILKTFGIHTNISHLKPSGKPVLSFIGLNGELSYMDVKVKQVFTPSSISLSRREREVLSLLIEGKNSEQIGETLYISKLTVGTHRKNILQKTSCMNTASLISMAIQKGWL
jgi:DNA-binding CsgD family transcriptional regulator